MTYWMWRVSEQEWADRGESLTLKLVPAEIPGFLAEKGDVLFLLHHGSIVGAVELKTLPSAGHEFDQALPQRIDAEVLVGLPAAAGLDAAALGVEHLAAASGDLVHIREDQGIQILTTLQERVQEFMSAEASNPPQRWLPPPPDENEEVFPPWLPETLGPAFGPSDAERYAYVAVDEMVGGSLGLSVAPWPGVDGHGRLRFASEDEQRLLGVAQREFEELLARERIVMVRSFEGQLDPETAKELRTRKLKIGDVFAVPWRVLETAGSDGDQIDVSGAEPARIYDISLEARERSQAAMLASLTAPLDEATAREVLGDEPLDEPAAEREAAQVVGAGPDGVIPVQELGPGEPG